MKSSAEQVTSGIASFSRWSPQSYELPGCGAGYRACVIECVFAEQSVAGGFIDRNQTHDHRFGWRGLGVRDRLLKGHAARGGLMNGDIIYILCVTEIPVVTHPVSKGPVPLRNDAERFGPNPGTSPAQGVAPNCTNQVEKFHQAPRAQRHILCVVPEICSIQPLCFRGFPMTLRFGCRIAPWRL